MTYEEVLRLVQRGKYAEADEVIIDALEKQIPQKPILQRENNLDYYYCPICGSPLNDYYPMNRVAIKEHHCVCGQAILWEEKE